MGAQVADVSESIASPAALYFGRVIHVRLRPFGHRFVYRVFSVLLDLDRLSEAGKMSPLFSIGRFNLLSFREADHGPRDGTSLQTHIGARLAENGLDLTGGRVLLLCYPRVLGIVFNPLSVYYCYKADGSLAALVYEVRNTFGGLHAYVAPIEAPERINGEIRQERDKIFYVSPFLDMDMRYQFRIRPPGEEFAVRILESDPQGPIFSAAMNGQRKAFVTSNILRACAAVPMQTLKILGAIHWQALKLWLKGAKYHSEPPKTATGHARPDINSQHRHA